MPISSFSGTHRLKSPHSKILQIHPQLRKLSPVKIALASTACFLTLSAASLHALDYSSVVDPNVVVTGIRSDSVTQGTDSVVITASYNIGGGNTVAALYNGSLANATSPGAVWNQLTPVFSGQTITSSSFYGPNTSVFTPSLGTGNVIAVGSYKYTQSTSGTLADHGLMYVGTVTGSGTWTQIDATPLVSGTDSLINTIAHSTMGNLVVGNYDTQLKAGNAFIYNRASDTWVNLSPAGSLSTTAYGIWQNGGSSSTSFTIAGGFSDLNSLGIDEGYLVDYDSSTGLLTNYKTYNYNNLPLSSLESHFDGITATADGFNLTGYYTTIDPAAESGFMASVHVNEDGTFSDAIWTDITIPGAPVTTGNTIIGDTVLGFAPTGTSNSYVTTIPEPGTWQLVCLGATGAVLTICLRRPRQA